MMDINLKSITITLFIVIICVCDVRTDNSTSKYPKAPYFNGPKHEPRFISFNTLDDGDLSVDLEFAVPFLSIPVKKSIDAAMGIYKGGAVANLNVGALILGAAMVFAATVVIPLLSSLVFKHFLVNPNQRSNEQTNDKWRIMTLIDQALIENNIDTTSCMQRTMCWLAKNSRTKLKNGAAASYDKIIDGLMTNYWVNQLIQGSAMQNAIEAGLNNSNCAMMYQSCKITQNSIQTFATKFVNYLQLNQ